MVVHSIHRNVFHETIISNRQSDVRPTTATWPNIIHVARSRKVCHRPSRRNKSSMLCFIHSSDSQSQPGDFYTTPECHQVQCIQSTFQYLTHLGGCPRAHRKNVKGIQANGMKPSTGIRVWKTYIYIYIGYRWFVTQIGPERQLINPTLVPLIPAFSTK